MKNIIQTIRATLTNRTAVIWGLFAGSSVLFSLESVARAGCNVSSSPCVPAPNEVCIFQNGNCGAPYVRVPANTTWYNMGGVGQLPNDSLTGIWTGSNAAITVCSDANFGGICETHSGIYEFISPCFTFLGVQWFSSPCCQSHTVCNDWASSLSTSTCGVLGPGSSLQTGYSLSSCDKRFNLTMQPDGNLVLYQGLNSNSIALWSTGTWQTTGSLAIMQPDGNFVLYDHNVTPLWASGTAGQPNSYLVVQNDGNLVVYNGATPIWASQTCCH